MQKSRENWIIYGDRNTSYFHTVTAKKRIRRKILGIVDKQGHWIDHQEGISSTFIEHFKNIFNSQDALTEHEIKNRLYALKIPRVSEVHQAVLDRPFTAEEVKLAAFQI